MFFCVVGGGWIFEQPLSGFAGMAKPMRPSSGNECPNEAAIEWNSAYVIDSVESVIITSPRQHRTVKVKLIPTKTAKFSVKAISMNTYCLKMSKKKWHWQQVSRSYKILYHVIFYDNSEESETFLFEKISFLAIFVLLFSKN